ncbi:unnamed protein product [Pleuronectes platessa]|uniref:Uncharacterized protein n=1 Tax=Pleuronectes platessa TaxID=8262 RepID=A0A9N7VNG7_PLEPL|nr:unnamed protein product [Pleuronectes platessa]
MLPIAPSETSGGKVSPERGGGATGMCGVLLAVQGVRNINAMWHCLHIWESNMQDREQLPIPEAAMSTC